MAASLCCTSEDRSGSPASHHARLSSFTPTRIRKSASHQFMLNPADQTELGRLFVAASLPEDHPDAMRIPGRKAPVNTNIIQSPTLGHKIRRRFSRSNLVPSKSFQSLKHVGPRLIHRKSRVIGGDLPIDELLAYKTSTEGGYDSDARTVQITPQHGSWTENNGSLRSPPPFPNMVLPSFEWLVPCIKDQASYHGQNGIATEGSNDPLLPEHRCRHLRRSISLPDISTNHDSHQRDNADLDQVESRRNFTLPPLPIISDFFAKEDLKRFAFRRSSDYIAGSRNSHARSIRTSQIQQGDGACGPTAAGSASPTVAGTKHENAGFAAMDAASEPKAAEATGGQPELSLHLNKMDILRELRTQSRTSDTNSLNSFSKVWNQRRHGMNLDAFVLPLTISQNGPRSSSPWSATHRQQSALSFVARDGSSSKYSRSVHHQSQAESRQASPITIPYQLNHDPVNRLDTNIETKAVDVRNQTRADPPILHVPSTVLAASTPNRSKLAPSVATISTPSSVRAYLPPSNSSSSTLSKPGKFHEELASSPPRKTLKKKRPSVMELLKPSRVKKYRPVATNASNPSGHVDDVPTYDGPSDRKETLTVPQEHLPRYSSSRSASQSSRISRADADAEGGSSLSRQTSSTPRTLEEYERSLTVQGDSRRRKSAINLEHLQDVPREERQDSLVRAKRPRSRATPLFGPKAKSGEQTLMEKALQKHHSEKAALFLKKRKDAVGDLDTPAPLFSTSFGPASSPAKAAGNDDIDPLSTAEARRSRSMYQLRQVSVVSMGRAATKPNTIATSSANNASDNWARRALPPAAWSRFPSSTRRERNQSAGRNDNVLSQDFAYTNAADPVNGAAVTRNTDANHDKKSWLSKSRSATFGGVWRYYSTLFTSSSARNRRSSVAMGGRLKHPELEILPPISAEHHHHDEGLLPRSASHIGHLSHHIRDEVHEMENLMHTREHLFDKGKGRADQTPKKRQSSDLGPLNERADIPAISVTDDTKILEPGLTMDGATDFKNNSSPKTASLAEGLSRLYRDTCVRLPASLEIDRSSEPSTISTTQGTPEKKVDRSELAPLPTDLKQTPKSKSPGRITSAPTRLAEPALSISTANKAGNVEVHDGVQVRRFPSVTVVDDRKGHWRSVSLISAQSGKSLGLRNSTHDLLVSMKGVEQAERMKLLGLGQGVPGGV